jgi:nicotinamidase-related amidase
MDEARVEHTHVLARQDWDAASAAVVVCDMWDATHCVSAQQRVEALAPRMNDALASLRAQGALVVHAPAGCMEFYHDHPARGLAAHAPFTPAPCAIDWNDWEPDELSALPSSLTNPGPCSCDAAEPCNQGGPPYPWTHQTELLTIEPGDAITDDGQELFNLLAQRAIADVVVMGVHTNLCVLGRPYGIRQLVAFGKRAVLCRDLTDAFHRDTRGHAWGNEAIVAHIERRWCPTATSDDLIGQRTILEQPSVPEGTRHGKR